MSDPAHISSVAVFSPCQRSGIYADSVNKARAIAQLIPPALIVT